MEQFKQSMSNAFQRIKPRPVKTTPTPRNELGQFVPNEKVHDVNLHVRQSFIDQHK